MAVKQKNTKKKMALLGLKKDKDGDYGSVKNFV